jgi:hypothetical protein
MNLHHFTFKEIRVIIERYSRWAREAVVINDLQRHPVFYCLTWLRTLITSPENRHDALLSVKKGFLEEELRRLGEETGDCSIEVKKMPLFRLRAVIRFKFESLILPAEREKLMFKTENSKLRNVLGRDVPVMGARACRDVISKLLTRNKLSKKDVAHWAVHPGGKTVLDRVKKTLKLTKNDLRHSYSIFENFGNMSSASVVFVLKEISESADLNPGDYAIMTSFGAGFTAFACLLRAV